MSGIKWHLQPPANDLPYSITHDNDLIGYELTIMGNGEETAISNLNDLAYTITVSGRPYELLRNNEHHLMITMARLAIG
jgi:hypothetical protein